jgi:hypothetical protein
MKLHVIFGQRKCTYPGEYAPEALDIMDEYGMDENPKWFEERMAEHVNNADFSAVAEVVIDVPDYEIDRRLFPARGPVQGVVVNTLPTPPAGYTLVFNGETVRQGALSWVAATREWAPAEDEMLGVYNHALNPGYTFANPEVINGG